MTGGKTMESCTWHTGKPKCRANGKICNDEVVKTCEDYKSDEGLYECPHCGWNGLKLMNYSQYDKVWECVRCGAELWYCPTLEEMKQRCEEIKNAKKRKTTGR